MSKNVYKVIAQAYLLERLSPATYEQMVDIIKNKHRMSPYTQQDILRAFDVPFFGDNETTGKQFKKVKDIIATRMKLDAEINKMLEDCPLRYTQYD